LFLWEILGEITSVFFCVIGNFVGIPYYNKKSYRAGSHCGGMEDVARSDPPQAENPASRIFFCCLKMEKRSSVG